MAEKAKPLTCTFFVGGKPVEKLTPEQMAKMAQLIGEVMSNYYTAHPEEYLKFKGENNETNQNKATFA